jgi:2-C-methyl-D-erythritol 4-phosphate cytidylyltransferase
MHEHTKRLIDRVHAQTMAGQIEWVEGSGRNAFSFEADGFHVVVTANAATASISITDADGRELETLDEEALNQVTSPSGRDYEALVREIHAAARRMALGTDDAIDRILRAIGD